jgi:zinc protease
LDNGITILVRENHTSPSVVIDGLLRAGAIDNQAEKAGLARFTASTLLRGSENRSFDQVFEAVESVGASLAFSAGQHTTEFGGRCLSEDLDLLLDIATEALRAPAFPEEQLDRVRGEIITRIQVQSHNTHRVAGLEFAKLVYPPEHPYSRSATGTVETVNSINRQDIVRFHRTHFGPRGMIVSIVGDIRAEEILPKLERRLGDWSDQDQVPQASFPPVAPLDARQERVVPISGKVQTDLVLGVAGPPRAADDFMHARLANTILGVFGLMGRLGARVRDAQGLAYTIYSEMRGGLGPGPWVVSAGVSPTKVSPAVESIREEIRRLQEERVPADELADNKSFLLGSLPIHLETNAGVSGTILDMELFGLGLDYLQHYPSLIQEIQVDQVQAAAQRYLDPDRFGLAIAGPPAGDGDE